MTTSIKAIADAAPKGSDGNGTAADNQSCPQRGQTPRSANPRLSTLIALTNAIGLKLTLETAH
jgi:hypothetical protein